jgi:hypothetical protein
MKDFGNLHFFLGMEVERDCAQHLLYTTTYCAFLRKAKQKT